MIKLQGRLPRKLIVACSGGPDSMAVADFLRRNHEIELFIYDHDTAISTRAFELVASWATKHGLEWQCRGGPLEVGDPPKGVSREEHWRNCRYRWFHSFDDVVVTAHHLDDCVETWIWSCLHGEGKLIPYRNRNVIRPFRLTRKRDFELWCDLNSVPYLEDDSNRDIAYTRNYIRHELMPHALRVNPGIHKTVKKKLIEDFQ